MDKIRWYNSYFNCTFNQWFEYCDKLSILFVKMIYLEEKPDNFFEDNQQYMLWTQNSDNSNMMTHYEYSGKEIKDIINEGNSN